MKERMAICLALAMLVPLHIINSGTDQTLKRALKKCRFRMLV
jgi:hypothetical protein